MVRSAWMVVLVLPLAGCMGLGDEKTPLVQASPFNPGTAAQVRARASFAPASTEAAARVDMLGRKIVEANKQTGLRPMFRTIGAPQPEIFHHGTSEIDVTEGLVNQCKSEGELAAVLCHELGKMVSEREALAGPKMRVPERQPPQYVPVGSDAGGSFGPADQTHLAELAKFEKERPRPDAPPPPPPDPQLLARTYLTKAGYSEQELAATAPLLQAAAANSSFEKQLNPNSPPRTWGQ